MSELPIRPAIKNLKEYVPGKTPEEAGVIKLASNENPLGPSPKALEEIKKRLPDISIYPDQNNLELRRKLAKKIDLSENNFIIGNGSDEVMQMIAATYLSAGDEVLISENTFSTYEFVTRLFDGLPVFIKQKNYSHDLGAFTEKVSKKTRLIFLCSPTNPTGTIIKKAELDAFLNKLPQNIIIVLDEAYSEYVESKDYPAALTYIKEGKNIVVLRTFSKIYGLAGLRVGYGMAKPEIIKYLAITKLPFNINRLATIGALAALEDSEHFEKSLINNHQGKKYFYKALSSLGNKISYVETEANFIMIDVKRNADDVFLALMREGVIIRPLTSFGLPQAIRVTIGTQAQNEKFIESLSSVLTA